MSFNQPKPKRSRLDQWYKDCLQSLSVGNTVSRTAVFKVNRRSVQVDIPVYMWRKALRDNAIMEKMRVVIMDIVDHQSK